MNRIIYLLSNELEADVRLSDAMLFAALKETLGDRLSPEDSMHYRPSPAPLWGKDPFRTLSTRTDRLAVAWSDPAVLDAVGGKIVPREDVQAEMDRIAGRGFGATLRNMRDPEVHVRYCARGDRFDQHATAIRSDRYAHPVLVCPNLDLLFVRRFLVVAGGIVAETPYRYCEASPTDLLEPGAWRKQAEDFMSPLTEEDPSWRDLQRAEADRLLFAFPLVSGAIDVGLRITADGEVAAHVQEVVAAPPGAFAIFYANVRAYARAVAEHLATLEPGLDRPEDPAP